MNNLFKYVEENFYGIFGTILLLLLMIFGYIISAQMSKHDIYNIEEKCYQFYQENGYILDTCYRYENKLKNN